MLNDFYTSKDILDDRGPENMNYPINKKYAKSMQIFYDNESNVHISQTLVSHQTDPKE